MASLRMLKAVMAKLHPGQQPYQVFDMIGGTSTGGYDIFCAINSQSE